MSGKDCLIVDDSRVVRSVARAILLEMNFEVREVANGQLAMDMCMDTMPDVILLDWNMPVMNGIEFLKKLRALPNGKCPAVLLCTTENEIDFIRTAIDAGADEYIMKPFDSEILKSKFSRVGIYDEEKA